MASLNGEITFMGPPCKRGHVGIRYTKSGACVQCAKIANAEWKTDHPSYHREKKAKERIDNPGLHAEKARDYRRRNTDKVRRTEQKYRKRFPDIKRAKDATRRARLAGSIGRYTAEDIGKILSRQKFKCAACGVGISSRDSRHIDHIIPLAKGGSNWPSNLQMLCVSCNLSKGDKAPEEFMRTKGLLL